MMAFAVVSLMVLPHSFNAQSNATAELSLVTTSGEFSNSFISSSEEETSKKAFNTYNESIVLLRDSLIQYSFIFPNWPV